MRARVSLFGSLSSIVRRVMCCGHRPNTVRSHNVLQEGETEQMEEHGHTEAAAMSMPFEGLR